MPRGNGTGPMGQGMMTGRKMGNCTSFNVQGSMNGLGLGCGMGRGSGRGRRLFGDYPINSFPVQQNEKEALKMESEALKNRLDQLTKRLKELEEKK